MKLRLITTGLDLKVIKGNRGSQGVGIALSKDAVVAWRDIGSKVSTQQSWYSSGSGPITDEGQKQEKGCIDPDSSVRPG